MGSLDSNMSSHFHSHTDLWFRFHYISIPDFACSQTWIHLNYQLIEILCTHTVDIIRCFLNDVAKLRWETDWRRLFKKECITVRVSEKGRQIEEGEIKCLHLLWFALCLHLSCTALKDTAILFRKNLTHKQDVRLEVTDGLVDVKILFSKTKLKVKTFGSFDIIHICYVDISRWHLYLDPLAMTLDPHGSCNSCWSSMMFPHIDEE